MGRMLGAFDNNEELDRPDLNKCPDCGCFFADDDCPLCGKTCPESMRAGNRRPVKKTKKKSGGPQYRRAGLDWYHRWWFIILMMIVSPMSIVGIVLLLTSPRKTSVKVIALVVLAVYLAVSTFGISGIVQSITNLLEEPVDRSLSAEEYIAACETVDAERFYRNSEDYRGEFVSLRLTVAEKVVDYVSKAGGGEYTTYYVCYGDDPRVTLLVRDCREKATPALLGGDMIEIFGEGAKDSEFEDSSYRIQRGATVNAAYISIIG